MVANVTELNETLQEMTQNCYDLLGDIIAVQGLCSYEKLQDCYSMDIIIYYQQRVSDYMNQHCDELTVLTARAVTQLKSVGDTFVVGV